jgi:hypothetical protein
MSELLVRITKRADGGSVLRCERADGSVTWQRQDGHQARFFPLHDLTHLAIESILGFRRGFYGLIAEGWDIAETEGKGARGPLPSEAVEVEHLVGAFDLERAGAADWAADALNAQCLEFATNGGRPAPRTFTDDDLARVRTRLRELLGRWASLAPGETLEVAFDRAPRMND